MFCTMVAELSDRRKRVEHRRLLKVQGELLLSVTDFAGFQRIEATGRDKSKKRREKREKENHPNRLMKLS